MEKNTVLRRAFIHIDDAKMADYRDQLARTVQDIRAAEQEKATVASTFASQLKRLNKDLNDLTQKIIDRREEQGVRCYWVHYWESNYKELRISATGEIIEKGQITDEEWTEHDKVVQEELPLAGAEETAAENADIPETEEQPDAEFPSAPEDGTIKGTA